jgi:hypothetical protein
MEKLNVFIPFDQNRRYSIEIKQVLPQWSLPTLLLELDVQIQE